MFECHLIWYTFAIFNTLGAGVQYISVSNLGFPNSKPVFFLAIFLHPKPRFFNHQTRIF